MTHWWLRFQGAIIDMVRLGRRGPRECMFGAGAGPKKENQVALFPYSGSIGLFPLRHVEARGPRLSENAALFLPP